MKALIIKCCNDCPFSFEGGLGTIADMRCAKSSTRQERVVGRKLPDWCPLEDLAPKSFDNDD